VEIILPLIEMKKTVQVVGTGLLSVAATPTATVSASPSISPTFSNNQARLGDTVEYTVRLTNTSRQSLNHLIFKDGYDYLTNDGVVNMKGTIYLGHAQAVVEVGSSISHTMSAATIVQEPGLNSGSGLLLVRVPVLEIGQVLVVKYQVKFSSNLSDFANSRVDNQALATSDEASALTDKLLPSDDPTTPKYT
jgi:hypothetical protein